MFEYVNSYMFLDVSKRYYNFNEVCAFVGLHFNNFIILPGMDNLKKIETSHYAIPLLLYVDINHQHKHKPHHITNINPIKIKIILRDFLNKLS